MQASPQGDGWLRLGQNRSIPRWMPAGQHLVAAHRQSVGIVAQVQGGDGRAPAGRRADYSNPIVRPREVVPPGLRAWVEQGDRHARERVNGLDFVALVAVTEWAGEPEVGVVITTPSGER